MILRVNKIVYNEDNSYYVTGPEFFELSEESKRELIALIDSRIEKREEVIRTNEELARIKKRGREEREASKWHYKELE